MAHPRSPSRGSRTVAGLIVVCSCLAFSKISLAADEVHDPLEKLNRATYAFNDALDRALIGPLARGYKRVAPRPVRSAFSNFMSNLYYPTTVVNQFLQGKPRLGLSDATRFALNSTLGVVGFFDPATHLGFAAHDEDFGQTLGVWGVPPGPYVMLPLFGPSDFRDAPSKYVDTYSELTRYSKSPSRVRNDRLARGAYGFVSRAELVGADEAIRSAYDPYAFLRDAYVKHRVYLIHDGNVPADQGADDLVPDSGDDPAPSADATATPKP